MKIGSIQISIQRYHDGDVSAPGHEEKSGFPTPQILPVSRDQKNTTAKVSVAPKDVVEHNSKSFISPFPCKSTIRYSYQPSDFDAATYAPGSCARSLFSRALRYSPIPVRLENHREPGGSNRTFSNKSRMLALSTHALRSSSVTSFPFLPASTRRASGSWLL